VQWIKNTQKYIENDKMLYGIPPLYYGTLNKQLTFYEIEDEYSKNYILNI
jgi:hypothetical protein